MAVLECRKFERIIGSLVCPKELPTMRDNLLRGVSLDEELEANEGKTTDVIPVL